MYLNNAEKINEGEKSKLMWVNIFQIQIEVLTDQSTDVYGNTKDYIFLRWILKTYIS